jgi:TonB-linked SusC/RagA family outer membrane protein
MIMQKMKKQTVFLLLLLFLCSVTAGAQRQTVSGTVTEASTGEPITGATIVVKGTSTGTVSDADGRFTLNATVDGQSILTVSYLGYITRELPIDKNVVDVALSENITGLDEFVVIGYGSVKKKDLTGSVVSMQGSTLSKIPVANVAQAMTGRLSGVQVTTSDGSPDAEILIRVRGGGSITGDNSPLYIVDGFPVSTIGDIASSDIQDITVLKDASSTAIYGARGANGVVLITTKNAQGGKTKISYNGYLQGKQPARKIDVMDPYSFVMFNYEKAALRNALSGFEKKFGVYDDLDLYQYQQGVDWQDDMFSHAGISQSHNLSVTGGTDKTQFALSSAYTADNSLMRNSGYDRFNLHFKLDHQLAENLKMNLQTRVSDTETNGAGTSGSTYKVRSYDALLKAPVNGLSDFSTIDLASLTDDELDSYLKERMSLEELSAQYWKKKNDRRYNFSGGISWKVIKNLTYRMEGGYEYLFNQAKNWYGPRTNQSINNGGSLPLADWEKKDRWGYRWANTLTYDKTFNRLHHVNLLAGQELSANGTESNKMEGKYFQEDITPEKTFASMASNSGETGSRTISSSLGRPEKWSSLFGRFNYIYDQRYYLTLTFRYDGSSKFLDDNRWGFFPAAALAWRVSEEKFMENTRDYLSNLKLRLSYGEVGNDRISSGSYETNYKAYGSSKYYGAGGILNPHYTLSNSTMANPAVRWETTITRNAALDYGFFNERLSGSVDLYWNTTQDLLLERKINAPGYESVMENIGQTSNRGVEVAMNVVAIQKKDFFIDLNFNIGFNRNRVDKLTDGANEMAYESGAFTTDTKESDDYRVIVGQPVGLIYGFVSDGIYLPEDFKTIVDAGGKTQFQLDKSGEYMLKDGVANNGYLAGSNGGVRPGAMKLKDLDGNLEIDNNDRQIIGRTTPKHTGGLGINAGYKGFDLSAMFNWVYGNKIYNMDKIVSTQSYRVSYANLREYMNPGASAWTYLDRATGEIVTDYARLVEMNAGKTYWSPLTIPDNNPIVTSWAVEDGSFLRFQNLTLGYTLPAHWTAKFACSQLRVYATVNNLYVWTNYTGYDPEVSSSVRKNATSNITPGIDYSIYPKSFSWTAGVNITF